MRLRPTALARRRAPLALALVAACGPDAGRALDLASGSAHHGRSDALWNGEAVPTLYPELDPWRQEAVVAVGRDWAAFCTGTLISATTVLTAGHCVSDGVTPQSSEGMWVRFGWDWSDPWAEVAVEALDFLDTEYDDIAVLTLEAPFTAAQPLPVRAGGFDAALGELAQAVGFGLADDEAINTRRNWGTLTIAEDDNWILSPWDFLDTTGSVQHIDFGDSGGPLLFDYGDGPQIIGVTSRGGQISPGFWLAAYAPVTGHQDWIAAFHLDTPACVEACRGLECGAAVGCDCGGCAEGHACEENRCRAPVAGEGGVCVGDRPEPIPCTRRGDCPAGERCYLDETGHGACGPPCAPEPCVADDPFSHCRPFDGPGAGSCVRPFAGECDRAGETCTTARAEDGVCRDAPGGGAPRCYAACEVVPSCPPWTGCAPAQCTGEGSAEVCERGCVPDCRWRECGGDGCGDTCGACGPDELCGDFGRCLPDPNASGSAGSGGDGGTGGAEGSPAGGGCAATGNGGGATPFAPALALALAATFRRRRRT